MRRRNFPSIYFGVFAGLMLVAQQAKGSDIPETGSGPGLGAPTQPVRFDLYRGYLIVVQGSAGSLRNLNFLVDTGTTPAVLDARIARKLDLGGTESASIVILGGRTPGEEASLPSLEIGPLRRSNLRVVTADLSFFEKDLGVRIDGIVGLDVLGQKPFVIDYASRAIRFGETRSLSVLVPFRLDRGLAVFEAQIDHTPMHLVFDTGAGSMVLFAQADSGTQGNPRNADSAHRDLAKRLRTLRLGAEEFRNKPAETERNPKPSQLDFDGLLSPAALGISRVSVDVQEGVLGFSR